MSPTGKSLRSGELARLTFLSSDTIRHYERMGILPKSPRTASGYRLYGMDAVDHVLLVQRALRLGFTLPELAEIFQVRYRGGAPCHRVLSMTEEKLRSLEREILELRQTQRYMRQLVRQWRAKLAHTNPGNKAMLLQSMTDKSMPRAKSSQNLKSRSES